MRGINLIIAILMTIGIFFDISHAIEEKRIKIFEMAESGQIFEFTMSPEEITTEDVDNARLIAIRKSGFNEPKTPVTSFEMAESGMVIEFPVDPPEIYAENRQR